MKMNQSENFFNVIRKINEVVFVESAANFYSHVLEISLVDVKASLGKNENLNGAIIEKIKGLSGQQMFKIMMDDCKRNDKPQFMAVTHGDLWINNIMFHYDENGQVDHVKFVDLQTIRYGNVVSYGKLLKSLNNFKISLTGLRSPAFPIFKHKSSTST